MSDAILTHGREELGIERYDRASSAGTDLCGRMLRRVVEEAGRPLFSLSMGVNLDDEETQKAHSEIEHWQGVSDSQLTLAVENGDYYTAVCYKVVLINLRTQKMLLTKTNRLQYPLND